MTTRGRSKRVYTLAGASHLSACVFTDPIKFPKLEVTEARDIKKVPQNPALYVRLALSGNKLSKTDVKRNPTPAWEHTCSLCDLVLRSRVISFLKRALSELRNRLPSYHFTSSTPANGSVLSCLVLWTSVPRNCWTDARMTNVS